METVAGADEEESGNWMERETQSSWVVVRLGLDVGLSPLARPLAQYWERARCPADATPPLPVRDRYAGWIPLCCLLTVPRLGFDIWLGAILPGEPTLVGVTPSPGGCKAICGSIAAISGVVCGYQ